jgi:Flp pilus assembly protein TadG
MMKQPRTSKTIARTAQSLWRNREGGALVEATVLVPVLFTLIFGVYEFSWVFYDHQLVSAGIRDAARYASKSPSPCDGTTTTDVQNLATTGTVDGTGAHRITGRNGWYWDGATVSVACTSIDNTGGTYRGGNTITIVTVSTNFPDNSLGFFPYLGVTAPHIAVSHSERAVQDTPAF